MRKFVLTFISLFIIQLCVAQRLGRYEMKLTVKIWSRFETNRCFNYYECRLAYSDQPLTWDERYNPFPSPFPSTRPPYWFQYTPIAYHDLDPIGRTPKYYSDTCTFPVNKIPKAIFTYARDGRPLLAGLCNPIIDYDSFNITHNTNCYDVTFYNKIPSFGNEIRVQIYPKIDIESLGDPLTKNPEKDKLPIDDKISLVATKGFSRTFGGRTLLGDTTLPIPSVDSIYGWQYGLTKRIKNPFPSLGQDSIDITTWYDFPDYINYTDSVSISARDLVGNGVDTLVGKNIKIRIAYKCGASNIIDLHCADASPHIIADSTIQPKCFGEKGTTKIKFDRALKLGEKLNIFLNTETGSGRSDVKLDSNNWVTLPDSLAVRTNVISLSGTYPAGISTYSGGAGHFYTIPINAPEKLIFSATTQNDVRCHNGNDGAIKITATGGAGRYKLHYKKITEATYKVVNFSNPKTHTLSNLDTGTYNIMVRDTNGCYEKNESNIETTRNVTIIQPKSTLNIEYFNPTNTTGAGLANGSIEIILKGGTPLSGGRYNVTWKKLDGTVLSSVTNTTVATGYQTILQNIGKGKYILNVTDSNFSIAASGATQGCVLIDTFNVTEPPPITINIEKDKYISCKGDTHGAIVAHVSGGIPLTTGIAPYTYKWFRREATDIDITQTDSVATNLKAGQYVVKIVDQNGIEKMSDVFTLTEPDILSLQFSTQSNSCQGDGSITAITTGGTTPYHFEWTTNETSDTTATINNQKEGDYYAKITDAHGCVIRSSVHLAIPQGIKIDNAITQTPSYYNSQDGAIQLTISGGNPPYTYLWGNGATTKDLQNITAGIYPITITDASGCTQTQTYTLQNPIRIIQTDGAPLPNGVTTKTLCNGQHIDIDATIPDNAAVYNWRSNNSFSANSAKVTLTNAGKYWVTITDSKGITASDTLIIKQNNTEIDASFVVSTQAFKGEKVTFVNISYPAPERISWLIPNDTKIETIQNNQNLAELIFKDTGTYTISMKAFVGACEKMITKKVIVIEGQQFDDIGAVQNPYIKEFTLAPNPNTGQFNVKIVLQEQGKIRLRMMNVSNSAVVNNKELSGSSQYTIPYNITLAPGVYILLLETAKGNQMLKMIVN